MSAYVPNGSERVNRTSQPKLWQDIETLMECLRRSKGGDTESIKTWLTSQLAIAETDTESCHSGLNADHSPLQLCYSIRHRKNTVRFVVDPASATGDLAERIRRTRGVLQENMNRQLTAPAAASMSRLISKFGPENEGEAELFPKGFAWFSSSHQKPGLALYISPSNRDSRETWKRIDEWFTEAGVAEDEPYRLRQARQRLRPSAVGLEGADVDDLRVKLYFQFDQPRSFEEIGVNDFLSENYRHFLQLVVGRRSIKTKGVFFCVGLHGESGDPVDTKIDICGCSRCLNYTKEEEIEVITTLGHYFGFDVTEDLKGLEHPQSSIAVIGMGQSVLGELRLNVYLKGTANEE